MNSAEAAFASPLPESNLSPFDFDVIRGGYAMMAVRLLNGVSFCEVVRPIGANRPDSDKKIPLLEGEPGAGHWLVHRGGKGTEAPAVLETIAETIAAQSPVVKSSLELKPAAPSELAGAT